MNQIKIFIELTRLNKPIGYMLLFWPCAWGLTYAHHLIQNKEIFIYYLFLFFLGSVLMRSAGCIFNDIVDKDFDKRVQRTKLRPIAAKKIKVIHALYYVLILCIMAFFVLIQFNFFTIALGLGSMILAFSYPYMKRITYWPQLFLGITFNWGIIMAWASLNNELSYEIILLYIAAIFWTLGYDTIYGAQDMSDDEIIGLKSTSIKFKKNIKFFVTTCYFLTTFLISYLFKDVIGLNFFSLFLIFFVSSLVYQIVIFDKNDSNMCLKAFKLNNFSGLLLFLGFMTLDV